MPSISRSNSSSFSFTFHSILKLSRNVYHLTCTVSSYILLSSLHIRCIWCMICIFFIIRLKHPCWNASSSLDIAPWMATVWSKIFRRAGASPWGRVIHCFRFCSFCKICLTLFLFLIEHPFPPISPFNYTSNFYINLLTKAFYRNVNDKIWRP